MAVGKQVSSEGFEALLLEARDGAQAMFKDLADESTAEGTLHTPEIEDARAVWHTADFALAMLKPGSYLPKREALEEAAELIDRLGESHETGGEG
jgi:hypothetical protein